MESSDSEADERAEGYYQPIAASPVRPNAPGVNVYTNQLFHDGDVLGAAPAATPSMPPSHGNFVAPNDLGTRAASASTRPGTATGKSLAAKRAERMQANLYEPNQTLTRAPGSPAVNGGQNANAPWQSPGQGSRTGGSAAAAPNNAMNLQGLSSSYDPNEEAGGRGGGGGGNNNYRNQGRQQSMQQGGPGGGGPGRYNGGGPHVTQTVPMPIRVDLSDIPEFLMTPGPRDGPICCYIVRDKGSAKMYPKYNLFLEDGKRFLLAARKRKKQTTSNYLISLDLEDLGRDSENYFGKLRSNFVGTDFSVFDHGDKPGQTTVGRKREELAAVMYQYNVLGTRGPRKMTAAIPHVDPQSQERMFKPRDAEDGMLERVKNNRGVEDIVIMRNKPPRWNEELNAYCLNFNGRVTEASVKNFQLVSDDDEEHVILQFGKIGKNAFTMDFKWPICALQAFGICLSSFDNKLACE